MDYIIYAPIGEQMESGYKTKDMKAEVKKEKNGVQQKGMTAPKRN